MYNTSGGSLTYSARFVLVTKATSDKMAQVNDPTVYIIHCANDVRRFTIVVTDAQY